MRLIIIWRYAACKSSKVGDGKCVTMAKGGTMLIEPHEWTIKRHAAHPPQGFIRKIE